MTMAATRLTCAFIILSMLADQPNLDVTTTQGDSVSRDDRATFSTRSPSERFIHCVKSASSLACDSSCCFSWSGRGGRREDTHLRTKINQTNIRVRRYLVALRPELEVLLGDIHKLFAVKAAQVGDGDLVHGLEEVEDLARDDGRD